MDIYNARELQKVLYHASSVKHKRMRTILGRDGTLAYSVIHVIEFYGDRKNPKTIEMSKNLLERMLLPTKLGVIVSIDCITDSDREVLNVSPEFTNGFYIREIIEID